ncbi:MAG: sulfite exporter TauE/SafE family protein [Cyanobacteria bacterium P01_A01_bin.45]
MNYLVLIISGLFAGVLAGFLGIGGGTVLVPLQLTLGSTYVQAVATSSLAIVITASSASIQNWRMGYLSPKRVLMLGIPAILTNYFIGVPLANLGKGNSATSAILSVAFGLLLVLTIYLVQLRKRLSVNETSSEEIQHNNSKINPTASRVIIGGLAGILAGVFGVGGGVIMVPLQILLLGEKIKLAIQTSLGVIVITSISSSIGHASKGNLLLTQGLILGFGGLIGAQISTRFLPKLPDKIISLAFRSLLAVLSVYMFWKGWVSYNN